MKATSLVLLSLLIVLSPILRPVGAVSAPRSVPLAQATSRSPTDTTTIQRIRNRGDLLIAGVLFDQPPFGYRNEEGAVVGFDVDLVRALAKEWGVTVQFVPVTPATRLQGLAAGQVDLVAAALPHTHVAEALIDFSTHYFVDNPALQPFALGVAQGDAYFRNLVDATLSRLQQNGKLTALYQQWFPGRRPPVISQIAGEWPYTFATTPGGRQPATTRLTQIEQRGKLLVGVAYDFAPFGFVGEGGSIQGFDIDLSREFARRWLGDATALELVRVTPETAIPLLRAGQVDLIIAALPLTWHNRALIDFSQSYFDDSQSVLTRADSSVQRLADLAQKVVAVSSGLERVNALTTLIMGAANETAVAPTVLPFQEIRSAQQALLLGQVDAVIGSSVALAQIRQANPTLKIAVAAFSHQAYAIGIPPFDAPLRDQVNLTLQAMAADGLYTTLYQHWFGATPDPLALWFADSAIMDAATPVQQPIMRLATLSVNVTPVTPLSPTLHPTATPSPALLLPPVSTVAIEAPRLILQPTATAPAPVANAAATPALLRPSLIATSITTSVTTDGASPTTVTTRPPLPTAATIRTGLNANARRAPSTSAPILAVLAGGTRWPVVAIAPDGQWVEVQLSDRVRAWVASQLLVADDGVAAVPATPTNASPPTTAPPTPTVVITHRVEATDTLAGIAKAYYGEQRHWRTLYEANRTLIGDDPNALPIGIELLIPPLPPGD